MNEALQRGRERYLKQVRNGEIPTREVLNPTEAAIADPTSRKKGISAKCYECCGFSKKEVTLCEMTDCGLWKIRPWQKKVNGRTKVN